MFLNKVKDFFIKKKFKKTLANVKHTEPGRDIKTIGILFDESYFHEKESLLHTLEGKGISRQHMAFFVFKDQIKKNDTFGYPVFSYKDISWDGILENEPLGKFIAYPFDMLISYYDTEKAPLMLVTQQSKAFFKVGFASVDSRLNHLMINTQAEQYQVFADELFKYLKILNKI